MEQDTLDRTASTFGITDVEFEDRALILKVLASLPETESKVRQAKAERNAPKARGFGVRAFPADFAEWEDEGDFGEAEGQRIASEMDTLESHPALGW